MKNDIQTMQRAQEINLGDVWEALMDADREILEVNRELKEKIEENDRQMQKFLRDLGRKFGAAIDDTFIPRLEQQCAVFGFAVERSSERVLFGNEHLIYAEIDVFLENRTNALAAAVKPQWYIDDALEYRAEKTVATIYDIREHIARMGNLRRYFDMLGDRRRLFGAVAASVFPEDALGFALGEGLYVIEEVEDRIVVKGPEGGARAW
jgi:hypothetical protein